MEPTEALISAELSMRNLVREVLGDEWREVPGLPTDDEIEGRQRGEANNRSGVQVSGDLLDFLYIRELRHVLAQKRQRFGEVFSNRQRFEAMVDLLTDYRNTPFHARNLTWFERDLVSGAAGYIVAAITQWRNAQDVNYELDYPQIVSVSDEWGNELRYGTDTSYNPQANVIMSSLDVGQIVHFTCRGSDADGRPLMWRLHTGPDGGHGDFVAEEVGETVELSFTTTPQMVLPRLAVVVTLNVAGNEYPPRSQDFYGAPYDDVRHGVYAVRRPRQRLRQNSIIK